MSAPPDVLTIRDLSVEIDGMPVLRGIDATVRAGQAVALLGGNGSGKSTLVRATLDLFPHQSGSVELFGTPLRHFRQWSRVGYVPQRAPGSLAGSKVREVVASGRLAHRRPFAPPRAADRHAVQRALELVGLADRAGSDLGELSGGQHQRVLIARALAGEPDLLVLDEPTAGVDLEHQQILGDVLRELLRGGAAVLVVLHEPGVLGRLIDQTVVLSAGRVAYAGPPGQLPSTHEHPAHDPIPGEHSADAGLIGPVGA